MIEINEMIHYVTFGKMNFVIKKKKKRNGKITFKNFMFWKFCNFLM